MDKEYVYYIANEDKISIVSEFTHKAFVGWLVEKYGRNVGDFYWEYKTREDIAQDFTNNFVKDVIFIGEL